MAKKEYIVGTTCAQQFEYITDNVAILLIVSQEIQMFKFPLPIILPYQYKNVMHLQSTCRSIADQMAPEIAQGFDKVS